MSEKNDSAILGIIPETMYVYCVARNTPDTRREFFRMGLFVIPCSLAQAKELWDERVVVTVQKEPS